MSALISTDEAHLFLEDRDPDPTLHLEHTHNEILQGTSDQRETETESEEDVETDDEQQQNSGSGSDHEVHGRERGSEEEVAEEERVDSVGEGGTVVSEEGKLCVRGRVKRKKMRVRSIRRLVTSSLEREGGVSRCGISRSKSGHRFKRVVVRKRLSTARQQHAQLKK